MGDNVNATDVLDRIEALGHLFEETVTVEVNEQPDGSYDVVWTSGDEVVLEASCQDEDTVRTLNAVPDMLHVMRLVMEEQEFMGTIPTDIVESCERAMTTVFDDSAMQ